MAVPEVAKTRRSRGRTLVQTCKHEIIIFKSNSTLHRKPCPNRYSYCGDFLQKFRYTSLGSCYKCTRRFGYSPENGRSSRANGVAECNRITRCDLDESRADSEAAYQITAGELDIYDRFFPGRVCNDWTARRRRRQQLEDLTEAIQLFIEFELIN
ncbi:hypothetical protein EVAR_30801_1 [Eumeta japonica]|uniref:Uncharacterized protein n=1 Tax=Eumeta variegata TaxID=151549 RepID=A0A4C1V7F1_EUMVA|nr:hypothetical protein EVAR_30801_1 [Eumeta japonica]